MKAGLVYEAARRAVPLPELWQRYGLPLRQKGKRFETSTTPCCGAANRPDAGSLFMDSKNEWRWHCFRCGVGGSAVCFVATMEGITARDAANKLIEQGGGFQAITGRELPERKPRVSAPEKQKAIAQVVKAIAGIGSVDPGVLKYLTAERGISPATVTEAHRRGLLRTLPSNADAADTWLRLNLGEDVLDRSGLLKGKRSAAAYRPLVFLPPGGTCIEFCSTSRAPSGPKALQYGEQEYPLVWHPSGAVQKVLVIEGGIDVLSVVDLGFDRSTMVIGLLGVSAWRDLWIEQIQNRHPKATWQLGFDLDDAGDKAVPRLSERLQEAGIPVERLAPWGGGNDWNDTLKAARAAF